MQIKKAKKAFAQIAQEEGMSIDAVRRELEFAIDEARNNPDPKIQAQWKTIPCKGAFPTPEEFIAHIAGNIEKDI